MGVGWRGATGRTRAQMRDRTLVLLLVAVAGCSAVRKDVMPTPGHPQTGVASWYGPGFHGKQTSSGAVYDQHGLTAAHRTLPLGTTARVTNLTTGRSVEVLINDRGPFVGDRVIDLSYGAACRLDMIGPGTATVRIDVLDRPGGASRVVYSVQVGAFSEEDKARELKDELARRYDGVYISSVQARPDRMFRVRVGPYVDRGDAERRSRELAALGLPAMIAEEPRP